MLPLLPLPSATHSTTELPKAVAIIRDLGQVKKLLCSGVPLTSTVTLTAAHCIPQSNRDGELAIINPSWRDTSFRVLRSISHPEFKANPEKQSEDFDLALIESENLQPTGDSTNRINSSLPFPTENREQSLWLAGFSPKRLGLEQPQDIVLSPSVWSSIKMFRQIPIEGKFLARSSDARLAAACAGDSGAPVWSLARPEARLIGIVVQANCEKGDVKAVDIARYENWITFASKQLSELKASRWAVWNNVR